MKADIDVFIPTSKRPERLNNLLCQIYIALNSGVDTRVTVAMEGDYPELMKRLSVHQIATIRFIKDAPQGNAAIPLKHCIENYEWNDWVLISACDDDCLLPWGLKHLWDATKGVSMVIGQTLGVSRKQHYDFSAWKIGISVVPCHVSTVMVNMRSLERLPKPWIDIDPLTDYLLVKRMADHFPYRIIPNVCHVQSFAEIENLGKEFSDQFGQLYGALL